MRIAFFAVVSPIQSALADFSEGLALALSRQPGVWVDLVLQGDYQPANAVIRQTLTIVTPSEFERRAQDYEVCLYCLGDHGPYHGFMLDFVHRYPGWVILNDLTLHRCILRTALANNRLDAYLAELYNAYGVADMRLANQIRAGLGNHLILQYPLTERVVNNSRGVIVQNQTAQRDILARHPQAQVACIPYPFFLPPGFAAHRQSLRAELGLEDHFVVGSFGIFVPDKHLEDCLSAFARVVAYHPRSRYILGGSVVDDYDLTGRIRELGLTGQVEITGWLPPDEFVRYMLALDVGIHLRYPHIGGTPYTPIRLMGLGLSTIISDIEPLAEMPQGACIKIAPDEYQAETLATVLHYLADHPEFRQKLGANARQFIARHHALEDIAARYIAFFQAAASPAPTL